jgi:hypothetical protein
MLGPLLRGVLIGLDLLVGVTALIGGLTVIPTLPPEWLAGSPFSDYTLAALVLTVIGVGAAVGAFLVIVRVGWGLVLSIAVGTAIAVFEIVETVVMGLDVWLHALGLGPAPTSPITGANLDGIPAPLGIPLPLWLQPGYFVVGIIIAGIALHLWSGRRRRSAGYLGQPAVVMS